MSGRINQQNKQQYNPDGAPGTIQPGAQGDPGRAPTTEEISAAVSAYLAATPSTTSNVMVTDTLKVGVAAAGGSGTYVQVTAGADVKTTIAARGSAPTVDLVLTSQGGNVVADSEFLVTGRTVMKNSLTMSERRIRLRTQEDDHNYLKFNQTDLGTTIGTSTGVVLATDVGGSLSYFNSSIGFETPVLTWGADYEDTTQNLAALSCALVAPTIRGVFTIGHYDANYNLGAGNTLTSLAATRTAELNKIINCTVYSYQDDSGNQRYGLDATNAQISNLSDGNNRLDVMSLIALLWQAVRELENREQTS